VVANIKPVQFGKGGGVKRQALHTGLPQLQKKMIRGIEAAEGIIDQINPNTTACGITDGLGEQCASGIIFNDVEFNKDT
jgi:hypothetical protein